jgi:hypothetical protein
VRTIKRTGGKAMLLKQKWILLYANPYRVESEKTGEVNEGVSLRFLTAEDLSPVENGTERGIKTGKDSVPLEKKAKIKNVPGIYEFTLTMKIAGVDNKAQIKVTDLDYVSDVVFETKK